MIVTEFNIVKSRKAASSKIFTVVFAAYPAFDDMGVIKYNQMLAVLVKHVGE